MNSEKSIPILVDVVLTPPPAMASKEPSSEVEGLHPHRCVAYPARIPDPPFQILSLE